MPIFEPKPILVKDENGETVNIRELPDRSVTDLGTAHRIVKEPMVVEHSDHVHVLSDHALYMVMEHERNVQSEQMLDNKDTDYGRSYNESLLFYAQEILHRFKAYDQTPLAQMYPVHQIIQSFIDTHLTKDPNLLVNGKAYTTVEDITRVTPQIKSTDDVRGNSSGFRAQIPYLSTDALLVRTSRYAREAANYGGHADLTLPYVLLEFANRVETGEIDEDYDPMV